MSARKQAENFFSRIEKYISSISNPKLINRILSELNLDGLITDNNEFNDFLFKIKTEEIDLKNLINYVKLNILNNEPLCSLLAFIEENNLISDSEIEKASDTLTLQVNTLCIMEAITITMANGQNFADDVYTHLIKRSGSYFPGNPIGDFFFGTPYDASLFERLKIISIKPGVLNILFHKSMGEKDATSSDVHAFITKKQLSGWNADIERDIPGISSNSTASGMGLNILEAAWEDSTGHSKDKGGVENAKSGVALITIMEEKRYQNFFKLVSHILPEGIAPNDASTYALLPDLKIATIRKKVSQFAIDSQWRDLYSSWNLFFVISSIEKSVFMALKLLLPTVFAAEPQNYKEVRLLSLFLFAYLLIGEDIKNNPFFSSTFQFKNATIILKKWGEINKEYGSELLQKLCPEMEKEVDPVFSHVFGNYPNLNFFRHLMSFGYNPSQYSLTSSYKNENKQGSPHFFASSSSMIANKPREIADSAPKIL